MNLAIVGGGAFGCLAATSLARRGHRVTLFEQGRELLGGASANNQNRLHLGFHYPRCPETVRQCREGFERFCAEFRGCVRADFPNAYFIAQEGSRTSPEAFLQFCDDQALPFERLELASFRPRPRNVSLGVLTGERVYDVALLRAALGAQLRTLGVEVRLGTRVERVARTRLGGFELALVGGEREGFDAVVNCAYSELHTLTEQLGHELEPRRFELTSLAVVELGWERACGLTVLDGPFVTVLPYGNSRHHLLYHVRHSVLDSAEALRPPAEWSQPDRSPLGQLDVERWFAALTGGVREFFPELTQIQLRGLLQGPRVVLADRVATDTRPSFVTCHEPGYLTVFAGKLDHCLSAADEVVLQLERAAPPPYRVTETTLPLQLNR